MILGEVQGESLAEFSIPKAPSVNSLICVWEGLIQSWDTTNLALNGPLEVNAPPHIPPSPSPPPSHLEFAVLS